MTPQSKDDGPQGKTQLTRPVAPGTILARLLEAPDLVRTIRALPEQTFSALVRNIGVEDAAEIVALATTEQLVAAFDEDLFANPQAGEREVFDGRRFVAWLEVLLEAGEEAAANRVAELSEDFVVQALSTIVLVLDHDELLARMSELGEDARWADKALESALSEELDGYLLVSRKHDGWDAALALVLALDRDHRPLLVRLLDRCASIASGYVDDLDALVTALSEGDSLAEDVEAEREDRRARQGYVEPRSARSFLSLARSPLTEEVEGERRDPITHAYFRDRERPPVPLRTPPPDTATASTARILRQLADAGALASGQATLPAGPPDEHRRSDTATTFQEAMGLLSDQQPQRFDERMEELVYLANVLAAGAEVGGRRVRPAEAAEAALATVALGAELVARDRRPVGARSNTRATPPELGDVLRSCAADLLFRKASSALVSSPRLSASAGGFLRSREELEAVVKQLRARPGILDHCF
ncbi:MAG: DUF6178 family protein [bacterium]